MFCPQCGQQQVTGVVRFCSRCGFPLDGVIQLLSNGGMIPAYHREADDPAKISPRRRGVKQGGVLLLSGAVVVPIMAMFASFSNATFIEMLAILAAIICFIGGPLRMLYAAVFEEGAPQRPRLYGPPVGTHVPQQFVPHTQNPAALPPPPVRPPVSWRRPNTAELANPPSVTENTTRLLEKEDRTTDH